MGRTAKSIKNISYGTVLQFVIMAISFITRTYLIKYIGIDTLGINGLFTEVISALSLAELGIGTSIGFNLYKAVAENDEYKICQLVKMYRKAYMIVASITFFIGTCICPWIHLLVNSVEFPIGYIRIVYMLFVIQLSTSYLFSSRISLLNVDQKSYICSTISGIVKIIGAIAQLILIICFHNYVIYLIVNIIINVSANIIVSAKASKLYPFLDSIKTKDIVGTERKKIFSNMKNVFIRGISARITSSTDNILISSLVSTRLVGFYSNYTIVFNIFRTITALIYSGILNSMGNMMASETNERCEETFLRINYLMYVIALISAISTMTCISPFITMWLGSSYILDNSIVIICCFCLLLEIMCKALWMVMEVSGLFSLDKYASIAGSIVNLIISIILGKIIGIVGIFIGTCFTYFIQMILKAIFLYKKRWNMSVLNYYRVWLKQISVAIILMIICWNITCRVRIVLPFGQFVANGIITNFIIFSALTMIYGKSEQYLYFKKLIIAFVKQKV